MRVLFVHNIPPWDPEAGGGQRVHHELALSLLRRGHDVHALFLGNPESREGPVPYPYSWVPQHVRLLNRIGHMAAGTRALLRHWIPDAAYLSAPEAWGVYRELPGRTGVLMTSHHPDLPHLEGSSRPWRPLRRLSRLRRYQPFYLERLLLRQAHRRTATSEYGRRVLFERGYLDGWETVNVVPNGVDRFWFQGEGPTGDRAGFLFVGRMDDQKGVDLLLEAFAAASVGDWRLDLIGDGLRKKSYEAQARDLGVEDRVSFLGHGDREQIRGAMSRAAVFVAPSRAENYPLILLEAMATGVPVLSTKAGGIPEMLTDHRDGILVDVEDVRALTRALEALAGDADLRSRLAANGLRVARRHDWDRVGEEIDAELARAVEVSRA